MSKKIVIAIDGGGIRGILPLLILRHLFSDNRLNTPSFQKNIEWYGTSSGALISASVLLHQLNKTSIAQQIEYTLNYFELRSEHLMEHRAGNERPLKLLIDKIFTGLTCDQLEGLNIVATELPHITPTLFNSKSPRTLLSDALLATTAIPELFPPKEINGKLYCDGYLVGKSPVKFVLENENLSKGDILLSLGTGILTSEDAIETQLTEDILFAKKHCKKEGIEFFRLNPNLHFASEKMDNTKPRNIFNLKLDSYRFIEENLVLLKAIQKEILE